MFQGSIVALVTPFLPDGTVDEKTLIELIHWHIESKTDAIVAMGTTGEAPTLSDLERIKITEICVREAQKKIPIIINTGTNNTAKSIELTMMAKEMGADGCMAVVPYYNKPTLDGVFGHFDAIGKVDLPLIVYHHPGRTGVLLAPQFFEKLEKIASIVGIKEAAGSVEKMIEMKKHTSIPILSGDDSLTLDMMRNGATGVISVLANTHPSDWKAFIDLCVEEKYPEAQDLYKRYERFISYLMKESNPIGVKYAMAKMGLIENCLRLPMTQATEATSSLISDELDRIEAATVCECPN